MKRKILTILVSLLFLTTIPSVMGVNSDSEDIEPCLDIGGVFLKGLVLFPRYSWESLTCFAIRLFYIEITPTERNMGWITFKWVTLENVVNVKTGRFNIIGYINGFFVSGLKIGR
jgi:hypothetical protein